MLDDDRLTQSSRVGLCRRSTVAAAMLLAFTLQGCAAAIGAGSIVVSDKTPVDHVYSLVSGKDCSFVRKRQGLTYCSEDELTPPVLVHCYSTLGEPTCYSAPEPFPGNQRKLGSQTIATATPAPGT
jgi:hypothetical protein